MTPPTRSTCFTACAFPVLLALGCGPEGGVVDPMARGDHIELATASERYSDWSAPVNLGAPINTPATEQKGTLSKDGLTLYFGSDRPGGFGSLDVYVSHRATLESPWEDPVNLGPAINSSGFDNAPSLSNDEHLLFFSSNRPGGLGQFDIYVSRRKNPNIDFGDLGWQPAVNVGPGVNSPDVDIAPMYLQSAEEGPANLYFGRGLQSSGLSDIYVAPVSRTGESLGPAVLVAELSVPGFNDAAPTVRRDGREIFFWSTRPGSSGSDLWTSTRQSVHEPWSTPVRLEEPLNSAFNEVTPSLSFDGLTLLFTSTRPGGHGGADIWMVTRSPRRSP
jgi:WD40 repeat protein